MPRIPNAIAAAVAALVKPYYPDLTLLKLIEVFQELDVPELLTIEQTCDAFKINRSTLWRLEQELGLKPLKIGGSVRYKRRDVASAINNAQSE